MGYRMSAWDVGNKLKPCMYAYIDDKQGVFVVNISFKDQKLDKHGVSLSHLYAIDISLSLYDDSQIEYKNPYTNLSVTFTDDSTGKSFLHCDYYSS